MFGYILVAIIFFCIGSIDYYHYFKTKIKKGRIPYINDDDELAWK